MLRCGAGAAQLDGPGERRAIVQSIQDLLGDADEIQREQDPPLARCVEKSLRGAGADR
ncbi:hypothetical protein [Nocardia sp. X0981]